MIDCVLASVVLWAILHLTNFYEEIAFGLSGHLPSSWNSDKLSTREVWEWVLAHHVLYLMIFPTIGGIMYCALGDRSNLNNGEVLARKAVRRYVQKAQEKGTIPQIIVEPIDENQGISPVKSRSGSPQKVRRPSALRRRRSPVRDAIVKEVLGFSFTRDEKNGGVQPYERK